ncbi:MAG: PAS domain S-box protein, partial [Bacteroidetes bacterium]
MNQNSVFNELAKTLVVCLHCSENGQVRYVTPNISELLELKPEKLIGKNVFSLVPEAYRQKIKNICRKIQEEKSSFGFNMTWMEGDKKEKMISLHISYESSIGFFCVVMPLNEHDEFRDKERTKMEVMKNMLGSMVDFVFLLDKDGLISDFQEKENVLHNSSLYDAFKAGTNLTDAGFPLKVEQLFTDAINKIKLQGVAQQIQYEIEAFGGVLYYQAKLSPIYSRNDELEYITVVSRDITSLVKSEQKQKELVKYYHTILDNFPTLIWRANKNKKIDYINKTLLNFTGRTFEMDRGDGWLQAVHPEDRKRVMSEFVRKFDSQKPFFQEYRIIHNSGKYRWVKDFMEPHFDFKGQFTGYIGNCVDIDDIRLTQKLLQDSEFRFRELFDNVPDIVFRTDGIGIIRKINKAATEILGYTSLDGKLIWTLFIPSERRVVYKMLEKITADGGKSFIFETKAFDLNSNVKHLQVKGFINYGKNHDVAEIYGIARDITLQKMLEKSLMKTSIASEERERKRIAGEIHDGIGPLLSGLKMYLQQQNLEENMKERQLKTLHYCRQLIDEAISQTRSIANNLTPGILNDFGLQKALVSHVEKINAIGKFKVNL